MAQVNWGVVGVGGIATRRTLPGAVADAPNARFLVVQDVRPEAAQAAAQQFGVPRVYATAAQVFADPEIQALYIATPVAAHAGQIMAAASAGKHVFIEGLSRGM